MDLVIIGAVLLLGPLLGMGTTYMMSPEEFKDSDWVELYSNHFWPWNWGFLVLMGLGMLVVQLHDTIAERRSRSK